MKNSPPALRSIAEVWRLSRLQAGRAGEIGRLGGVVLIREGEVCGVRTDLSYAAVEPGLFAVDQDGRVFTVERLDNGRWSATWVEVGEGGNGKH